ncbi:hypothetical protein VVT58_14605 [Sphingobium sp. SJ10-10]|uniref:hypothetical protein n=1 Tax=Sphingobium sp. SJ10-10 TaxID=3114999 RepID=UPI002E1939CC|nr:hypothetical protein [Sphingobium sp. SJ10-10]
MNYIAPIAACIFIGIMLELWAQFSNIISYSLLGRFNRISSMHRFAIGSLISAILIIFGLGIGLFLVSHFLISNFVDKRIAGVAFIFGFGMAHLIWRWRTKSKIRSR